MFPASVKTFAKSMGGDCSLLPCPSLDEADDCRPMHVVVKKNSKWCFRKPVYSPKPFLLQDLLVANEALDVKLATRDYVTYNMTSSFSVNGDVGAALKNVVDLKLSASDAIHVEAKLGAVQKVEVDDRTLLKALEGRLLHFNHNLVREVVSHPRKVLCVVIGTVVNKEASNLHLHATVNGKEVFNISNKDQKVATGDISAGINDDEDKSFIIPKNTPLAYSVYELLVSPGGNMSLVTEKDASGGFIDFDFVDAGQDSVDGKTNGPPVNLTTMFAGLLNLTEEKREALRQLVFNICKSSQDRGPLLSMLESWCEGNAGSEVSPQDMEDFSQQLSSDTWKDFLQMLGYRFKEDGGMCQPAADSRALLDAGQCLLQMLVDLDEDVLACLTLIADRSAAQTLFSMLKKCLKAKDTVPLDEEMKNSDIFKFLKALGFKECENTLAPSSDKFEIHAAYCVVFALWLTSDAVTDISK